MFTELLWTLTMTAAFAQPGAEIEDYYDSPNFDLVAPVIRRNLQEDLDNSRRKRHELFTDHLDRQWRKYREGGSTAEGRKEYEDAVRSARRMYVERDPLYVPIYNER